MNNKTAIAIVVIVLILLLGWMLLRNGESTDIDVTPDEEVTQQVEELRNSQRSGVVASGAAASDGATELSVEAVNFLSPGFIVIRSDENGTPGDVLGASGQLTGFSEDIVISLDRPLVEGETVYIVLYADSDADGSFDATGDEVITDAATGAIIELMVRGSTDNATTTDDSASQGSETHVVTYTDTGFGPGEITISVGDTVRFEDQASGEMWVASAMHPTHSVYAGTTLTQHCQADASGAFDQCETGGAFEFTFTKEGSWGYHNHVQASHTGRIIVE